MLRYTLGRALSALPTLVAITFAAFLLVHLAPGDPARIQLGLRATPAQVEALRRSEGLDRPLWAQYWSFLKGSVHGDFGSSLAYHQPVSKLIGSRIAPTALVVTFGMLVALALAIPAAIVAALRRDRWPDQLIRAIGMFTYLMPAFWLGLLMSYFFGLQLHWFPTSGYGHGLSGALKSLVLPSVTLGLLVAPLFVRTLRSSIVETLESGFVEAARARGLSDRRVMVRHVLRNSAIPTITVIGLSLGFLVSGSVIIESVFDLPGLGQLFVASVTARDFPVIEGLTVLFGAAVVVINVLTDLAYGIADPRVRL
jgi:peptide/nickel transport system permease protein